MSQVSPTNSLTPTPTRPARPLSPGWPEIVVGLVGLTVVGLGLGSQLWRLALPLVVYGPVFIALSGLGGIAGFAAVVAVRLLSRFGVRWTSGRWVLIAIGAGVAAFALKGLAIWVWIRFFGDGETVQATYAVGGSGGLLSLVLATAFLSVLTLLGRSCSPRGHRQRPAAIRAARRGGGQHSPVRRRPRAQRVCLRWPVVGLVSAGTRPTRCGIPQSSSAPSTSLPRSVRQGDRNHVCAGEAASLCYQVHRPPRHDGLSGV